MACTYMYKHYWIQLRVLWDSTIIPPWYALGEAPASSYYIHSGCLKMSALRLWLHLHLALLSASILYQHHCPQNKSVKEDHNIFTTKLKIIKNLINVCVDVHVLLIVNVHCNTQTLLSFQHYLFNYLSFMRVVPYKYLLLYLHNYVLFCSLTPTSSMVKQLYF